MTLQNFVKQFLQGNAHNKLSTILMMRELDYGEDVISPEAILHLVDIFKMLFRTYEISAIEQIQFWTQFYAFASQLLQIPVLQTS